MPLPQTLKQNEKGVALYTNGVFQGYENIIILSDKEVAEELAEIAERAAMEKAEELIDAISNMSEAKVFLKRLVRRLIKNGSLP